MIAIAWVSEGFFAEILRKIRGSLQRIRFIAAGKGAKFCGKFAELSRKFAENFRQ